VSEKNNSGEHETATQRPDGISLSGRQHRRRQGADVDGMSRRKSVEPLSGQRDPTEVSESGQAVRSFLVEYRLEQVRQGGGDKGGEQDVIAPATHGHIAGSRIKPPAESQGAKHVFVGTPRHGLREMLGRSTRPLGVGDGDVGSVGFTRTRAMVPRQCPSS
jgi:hypothetical protein